MECVLHILDWILFVLFAVNILYLLIYSLASRRRDSSTAAVATAHKRFAILIPAYKEDAVIHECVESCLEQDYPTDCFDVVVISDRMKPETNASLSRLPIRLVEVKFEKSTKSKSLNAAMQAIGDDYDIAVVLDADNIIPCDYLTDINNLFAGSGVEIVQTHRMAKNLNTDMAFLDAISEEINNSIFRLGHARLGMSAALIGSGMAFRYRLFRDTMANVKAIGGFDRELELTLLYQGHFFHYLPETYVFDEKIQNTDDFSRQRRRWLSAQLHYCRVFVRFLFRAIADRKWDFCDKLFQQFSIPRLLLLGFTGIFTLLITIYDFHWSLKWWLLLALLVMALLMAVPKRYCTTRLVTTLCALPNTFWVMALNIFKLRGANKTFIHTAHGVTGKDGNVK
ncbi:MAG: glycosyltransferase family 2 protein [Bacteroides sp.]|nr:glycosyltransferase family 2 protein [Bacteroides sp.]